MTDNNPEVIAHGLHVAVTGVLVRYLWRTLLRLVRHVRRQEQRLQKLETKVFGSGK